MTSNVTPVILVTPWSASPSPSHSETSIDEQLIDDQTNSIESSPGRDCNRETEQRNDNNNNNTTQSNSQDASHYQEVGGGGTRDNNNSNSYCTCCGTKIRATSGQVAPPCGYSFAISDYDASTVVEAGGIGSRAIGRRRSAPAQQQAIMGMRTWKMDAPVQQCTSFAVNELPRRASDSLVSASSSLRCAARRCSNIIQRSILFRPQQQQQQHRSIEPKQQPTIARQLPMGTTNDESTNHETSDSLRDDRVNLNEQRTIHGYNQLASYNDVDHQRHGRANDDHDRDKCKINGLRMNTCQCCECLETALSCACDQCLEASVMASMSATLDATLGASANVSVSNNTSTVGSGTSGVRAVGADSSCTSLDGAYTTMSHGHGVSQPQWGALCERCALHCVDVGPVAARVVGSSPPPPPPPPLPLSSSSVVSLLAGQCMRSSRGQFRGATNAGTSAEQVASAQSAAATTKDNNNNSNNNKSTPIIYSAGKQQRIIGSCRLPQIRVVDDNNNNNSSKQRTNKIQTAAEPNKQSTTANPEVTPQFQALNRQANIGTRGAATTTSKLLSDQTQKQATQGQSFRRRALSSASNYRFVFGSNQLNDNQQQQQQQQQQNRRRRSSTNLRLNESWSFHTMIGTNRPVAMRRQSVALGAVPRPNQHHITPFTTSGFLPPALTATSGLASQQQTDNKMSATNEGLGVGGGAGDDHHDQDHSDSHNKMLTAMGARGRLRRPSAIETLMSERQQYNRDLNAKLLNDDKSLLNVVANRGQMHRHSVDIAQLPLHLAAAKAAATSSSSRSSLAMRFEGVTHKGDKVSKKEAREERRVARRRRRMAREQMEKTQLELSEEPVAPAIRIGQRVAYREYYGNEFGTVRWIGRVPQICPEWTVGVEFDNAIGEGDGSMNGRRYFVAKDCFAKFLPLMSVEQVDQTEGRPEPGTMISLMSASVRPGQMISIQRVSTVHVQHCFLNAPHRRPGHDLLAVNNRLHCQCPNCGPCAHLIKPSKSQRLGRAGKNATHMCQFSTYTCCGMRPTNGDSLCAGAASSPNANGDNNGTDPNGYGPGGQPQFKFPPMGNSWIEGSGYLTTLQAQQAKLLPPEFRGSVRSSRRRRRRPHHHHHGHHHHHRDGDHDHEREHHHSIEQNYENTLNPDSTGTGENSKDDIQALNVKKSSLTVDNNQNSKARRESIENRYLYPDDANYSTDSADGDSAIEQNNKWEGRQSKTKKKKKNKSKIHAEFPHSYMAPPILFPLHDDDSEAEGRSSSKSSSRSLVMRGLRSLIACMSTNERPGEATQRAGSKTRNTNEDMVSLDDLGYNSHPSITAGDNTTGISPAFRSNSSPIDADSQALISTREFSPISVPVSYQDEHADCGHYCSASEKGPKDAEVYSKSKRPLDAQIDTDPQQVSNSSSDIGHDPTDNEKIKNALADAIKQCTDAQTSNGSSDSAAPKSIELKLTLSIDAHGSHIDSIVPLATNNQSVPVYATVIKPTAREHQAINC